MNPTFACRQLHTSSVKLLPPAPYSSTGWSSYPSAELSPSADELVQLAVRSFKASQQQWWFPSKHHIGNSDSAGDSEWLSCQGMEGGVASWELMPSMLCHPHQWIRAPTLHHFHTILCASHKLPTQPLLCSSCKWKKQKTDAVDGVGSGFPNSLERYNPFYAMSFYKPNPLQMPRPKKTDFYLQGSVVKSGSEPAHSDNELPNRLHMCPQSTTKSIISVPRHGSWEPGSSDY